MVITIFLERDQDQLVGLNLSKGHVIFSEIIELFENLVFWQYGLSLLYLIFSTWVNLKKFGMLYPQSLS